MAARLLRLLSGYAGQSVAVPATVPGVDAGLSVRPAGGLVGTTVRRPVRSPRPALVATGRLSARAAGGGGAWSVLRLLDPAGLCGCGTQCAGHESVALPASAGWCTGNLRAPQRCCRAAARLRPAAAGSLRCCLSAGLCAAV